MQIRLAAANLLELEAHVHAHEGDARGATRSIRTLLSLARSIENEPVIISQLVGYTCQGIAYDVTDELLPHVDFSDEDLEMLQRDLRRSQIAEGLRRGLVGERVIGIQAFRHPGRPSTNEDLSLYLEIMSRYIEAAGQPWHEALKLAGEAEQDFEATAGGSLMNQMRYWLSNLLLPALEGAITAGARTDAGRGVLDTAIAVERYRREVGQPPQSLEALVPKYLPAVPSDPFDGQPLRYVLEADEIVIYSIGRDQVDDGGEGDLSGEPDIVVRLPRE